MQLAAHPVAVASCLHGAVTCTTLPAAYALPASYAPHAPPAALCCPTRLWKLAEPEKTLNELRRMKSEDLSFEQVGHSPGGQLPLQATSCCWGWMQGNGDLRVLSWHCAATQAPYPILPQFPCRWCGTSSWTTGQASGSGTTRHPSDLSATSFTVTACCLLPCSICRCLSCLLRPLPATFLAHRLTAAPTATLMYCQQAPVTMPL